VRTCIRHVTPDPAPLTVRQLAALIASAGRQLAWGLPAVAHEVRRWRRLAEAIPDAPIRDDALDALRRKRGQTDGAALFAILPRAANLDLLRALVSYQILWDFLDSVGERFPAEQNGRQLNRALIDALEPDAPFGDYYRHHPWSDDGGYLRGLVDTCREACRKLPGYPAVRALVLREAHRAGVLALNHDVDARRRVTALRAWAGREFPSDEAAWFELTGAASAGLTIFALLAVAAEPECCESDVALTAQAYFPWPGALATMLDSYVDQDEDVANGAHIYISYYESDAIVVKRTGELVGLSLRSVSDLPSARKHFVIISGMVAMYLSKDSARSRNLSGATASIAAAGGSLTVALLPVLRLWRVTYRLRSM